MSSPTGRRLTEGSVTLIQTYLKAQLPAALAVVRSDRADALVTTEPPQSRSYFIYPSARGFKTPAIFIIGGRFDFKQADRGANFIDGVVRVNVSAVVEDKNREHLEYKAWRYQSALHQVLDQTSLTSVDSKLKISIVVIASDPSPPFTNGQSEESPDTLWRKEILLECDVHHFENF